MPSRHGLKQNCEFLQTLHSCGFRAGASATRQHTRCRDKEEWCNAFRPEGYFLFIQSLVYCAFPKFAIFVYSVLPMKVYNTAIHIAPVEGKQFQSANAMSQVDGDSY